MGEAPATLGATDWLGLGAAPTFAIMALLTGVLGGGKMAMICGTAQESTWIGGMVPMYLLMSGFHLAPWLKLIANRRARAGLDEESGRPAVLGPHELDR